MSTLHSEAQISVASNSQTDSILVINGKKAVATKNLILGFEVSRTAFDNMWSRNENEFLENSDWNWYNSHTSQIVDCRNNNPKIGRIFWTTGVSKASTKFNSVKAKEFAQKMFDNYGSQLDGETKLVKIEAKSNFSLPTFDSNFFKQIAQTIEKLETENQELKPKANYFDIVVNQNPENLSVVETTSRFLNQEKGIKISYVKVWEIMRDEKWLIYQKKSINSETKHPFPSQKAKDNCWLTTTEKASKVVINKETGEEKEFLNTQILITPAGRLELLKLVQKNLNDKSSLSLV
jgi:phage antirepressor YoqD-like protein